MENRPAPHAHPGARSLIFAPISRLPYSGISLPLAALLPVWQHGGAMNESENQVSFTRAAPSANGRA